MLDQGQDHPAGDPVVGPLDSGRAELLLDHQLLDGVGRAPPRLGPVRHHVAGLDQLVALGLLVQGGDRGGVGADAGAQFLGLGRQVEAVLADGTGGGPLEDVGGRCLRATAAEQCRGHHRATQVQMRVVFPGESDAAVHLDVEFGVADVGGKRQRRGHRRDQAELHLVL